jgi:hypothetical protein
MACIPSAAILSITHDPAFQRSRTLATRSTRYHVTHTASQPATHSQRHSRSGYTIYNDTHSQPATQLQRDIAQRTGRQAGGR